MLILPDYYHAYLIESSDSPVLPKYNWNFDAIHKDFMLKPILMIEEIDGPVVKVRINKFDFLVPTSWNILVVDDDSLYVDTVPIIDAATIGFKAFLMSPQSSRMEKSLIEIIDFIPEESIAYSSINRGCMMCHPVGPITGDIIYNCLIGPTDLNKYLQNTSAQELMM